MVVASSCCGDYFIYYWRVSEFLWRWRKLNTEQSLPSSWVRALHCQIYCLNQSIYLWFNGKSQVWNRFKCVALIFIFLVFQSDRVLGNLTKSNPLKYHIYSTINKRCLTGTVCTSEMIIFVYYWLLWMRLFIWTGFIC